MTFIATGEAKRLDLALVERGLAPSRARARDAILRGCVLVDGETVTRPSATVPLASAIAIDDPAGGYVSRSALKLAAGLDAFRYEPTGLTALDIGASTGGFTEVLLARGATRVFAVDVGHGQLHAKLAADPRVIVREGLNARDLIASDIEGRAIGAIVADVSFISLKIALPPALSLAAPEAWGIFLVKPQFEAGRAAIGKGGIVRDEATVRRTVDDITAWLASDMGWRVNGVIPSPISGGDGNREYLVGARRG